jgi:hypothetical protein
LGKAWLDDRSPLPDLRSIETIVADPERRGETPFLVPLNEAS